MDALLIELGVAGLIGLFALGFYLGMVAANNKWVANTSTPARQLHQGKFYKVVRLGDAWSWQMLNIHTDEQPDITVEDV